MNAASGDERLPRSVGGLIDFAYAAYAARAPLYLGLALAAFAVQATLEYVTPAVKLDSPQAVTKLYALEYTAIFVDAFIVAAVAAGAGASVSGSGATWSRIAGAAVERWLPLVAISLLVQAVIDTTIPLSALGRLPDPPWAAIFTAPVIWLVWGILGLAAPIAALSGKRPALAVFDGLWQAVSLSLHPANAARLCIVAFVSILPFLLQAVALDVLMQHHVARPIFWSNVPIDALTVGPLAAVQTAFALDFARRAGRLERPRSGD